MPQLKNVKEQRHLSLSTATATNVKSAKISTAATEASALDQILHGAHAHQDTLERSVKRVIV